MEGQVGMEVSNDLMAVFAEVVTTGFAALQGPVDAAFGLMIALVVALTGVQWALSPQREILAAAFGKVLLIGFFAWLINDWRALTETLQAGFIDLGLAAGGGALSREAFLNPGAVLHQGWTIVKALGDTSAPVNSPVDIIGNLADALILGLAMIGIMLAFVVLALQIIVTLLEFKIVTLGGFVLLPFGIWSKSAFLAERPLGYVVAAGLKSLALAIVVAGAASVFDQLQPSANPDLYETLAILAAAVLLAMLAVFIPNLAAALVTGGPALGAGAAAAAGLAVAGGGLLAGAGAYRLAQGTLGAGGRTVAAFRAAAGAPSAAPPRPPPASPSSPPPSDPPAPPSSPGPGGPPPPSPAAPPASAAPTGGGPAKDAPDRHAPSKDAPSGNAADGEATPAARKAEAAFRRALKAQDRPPSASDRRSAALQAFFTANAGRSLLPGHEASGTLSPQIKPEEP